MATRDRYAETITEEDLQRTRRDRLAHLAQERARMEMANRLGIDYEYLGTLRDQADNQIQNQMPNELTIDPIELTIPSQPRPRYQSGFDGQLVRQGTVVPPQTNTTGISLLGETAVSLANDIIGKKKSRLSQNKPTQEQATMPVSSANNPVMTGILQALSQPQSVQNVTGSPAGYSPEMIRAQSQQPRIDREAGADYRAGSPAGYMSAMENESMNPTRFSGLLGQPGVEQRQISGAPRDVVDRSNPIPIDPVRAPVQYIGGDQQADATQQDSIYSLGNGESGLGLKGPRTDPFPITPQNINSTAKQLEAQFGNEKNKSFDWGRMALALSLGFNSLRSFPDQALAQFVGGTLATKAKTEADQAKAMRMAQWFAGKDRMDLAQAVAQGMDVNEALKIYNKKPEETFREFTAEEYKAIEHDPLTGGRIQVSNTSGKIIGGPYTKSTAPTVTLNVGEKGFEQMGKEFAKGDVELVKNARKAVGRISSLNNTSEAIIRGAVSEGKEGFETGPFAELRKGVDAFLVGFGNRDKQRVSRLSDAELINATLGADVFGAIGELGIGARGLDTPAEREFLRQVLTGTIETTPAALLYMSYLRQKIQRSTIDTYNEYLDAGVYGPYAEQRNMQKIQSPETIFGREFNNYKEMQDWLEEQKTQYSESTTTQGAGTVTKDGIEYEIEEVQ